MTNSRVLSGIKPSGKLHIGNYLGMVKNAVSLQDKYECYYAIVDLHSLTEDFDPKQKSREVFELAVEFLAAGLDPKKSTIFVQSHVPEHTQLAWIFSCLTPVGELERMTQYKDFVARGHSANAGLFTYPVLQTADILLYKPKYVPIGRDQRQHLELANKIVRWFNNRFGSTFERIEPLFTFMPRVMSLLVPEQKMSKSLGDNHCIYLDDEPEVVAKKLKKAVASTEGLYKIGITDTNTLMHTANGKVLEYPEFRGGINLFRLFIEFAPEQAREFLSRPEYKYEDVKQELAQIISQYFAEFREKRKKLLKDPAYVQDVLAEGAKRAREVAGTTLAEVYKAVGLQ